jgi:hypothetical protein
MAALPSSCIFLSLQPFWVEVDCRVGIGNALLSHHQSLPKSESSINRGASIRCAADASSD